MAMMKVRLFLENLNGWQRSWCLVSLTWLVFYTAITAYNVPFPTEDEISLRSISSAVERFKDERDNIESARAECQTKATAAGITMDWECLKNVSRTLWRHSQNINDAASRIQTEAEEGLLPSRISVVEKGAAVAILPILGIYLFGMGIAWVRRGFPKTVATGESVDSVGLALTVPGLA
jgi:hypothetical protein